MAIHIFSVYMRMANNPMSVIEPILYIYRLDCCTEDSKLRVVEWEFSAVLRKARRALRVGWIVGLCAVTVKREIVCVCAGTGRRRRMMVD